MASLDEDELEYLQPGFNPTSLTVARLRGILVQYDISYAASAKKPELVATFNEQLVPRARKILAARSRTTRTSKGITDMPGSQEQDTNEELEGLSSRIVTETPRRKTGRTSHHSAGEAAETMPAPRKTPSRRKASTQDRTSDPGATVVVEEPATTRRSQKVERPVVKVEESDSPPRRSTANESVFSDDNPFQSGSSPLAGEERRRSSGTRLEKRKSTSRRRRTDHSPTVKQEEEISRRTSYNAEQSVFRARQSTIKVEAGEEFTPQEQEELMRGEDGPIIVRQSTESSKRRGIWSTFWTLLMAVVIGYGFLWRKEKIELGYCGVGKKTLALEEYGAPDWLYMFQPECEPCPPHASCYPDMRVKCDADFVLKPNPLSIWGSMPFPPTCEPDGEKVRKVHAVAEKAVEELRERRAKFECGELTDEQGKAATVVEIEEPRLKAEVSQKRRRGMSEAEFEDLWKGAIGEIISRDEVTSEKSGLTATLQLASNSFARLPFGCAVRRSARLTLARYRVEAAGFLAFTVLAFFVRNYLRTLRGDTARIPSLVSTTLDKLATQATLQSQGLRSEPWISAGRLRDDVLREEFSAKRREDIWRRVQVVVEMNANVRSSVREDHNGEVSRVWEWIGSLPALEDGPEIERRRSGQFQNVERGDAISRIQSRPKGSIEKSFRTSETRKWDEGRPIY